MNFLKNLHSGADLGRRIKVAGLLLGQRFLEKIQNGGRMINIRLTRVSRVKKVIPQFYWFIACFGFNWGESYFATVVTPKKSTKMRRNRTFVLQIAYFSSNFRYKKQLLIVFLANFEQIFFKLRETFWKISSKLWKALISVKVTGIIEWGQKSKAQKIPGPKFNSQKISCRICQP